MKCFKKQIYMFKNSKLVFLNEGNGSKMNRKRCFGAENERFHVDASKVLIHSQIIIIIIF